MPSPYDCSRPLTRRCCCDSRQAAERQVDRLLHTIKMGNELNEKLLKEREVLKAEKAKLFEDLMDARKQLWKSPHSSLTCPWCLDSENNTTHCAQLGATPDIYCDKHQAEYYKRKGLKMEQFIDNIRERITNHLTFGAFD